MNKCQQNIKRLTEKNKLYRIGLHESMYCDTHKITRVAGGWIYETQSNNETNDGHVIDSSVFVPYSEEFI